MPVSDEWKARTKAVEGQKTSQSEAESLGQVEGQESSTAGPLSAGRTKGLAGFWASQNDEVKGSRKKRLEAVETPATGETVVENAPQRLDGVVRADDPGEWKKPVEMEAGRTRNVASVFQQQQNSTSTSERVDVSVRRRVVSDTEPSQTTAASSDVVLNRSSATVVLAENDPAQLSPDIVRSSGGSSWDDVNDLEAGRTRNLLKHWRSTEEDAAQPKTSTTKYQDGAKPAWILEIEEAKATSPGAIGQSAAWTDNSQQQQQQQQQQEMQQEVQQEMQKDEEDREADRRATEEAASREEGLLEHDEVQSEAEYHLGDETSPVSTDVTSSEHVTVSCDPQYDIPSVSVSNIQSSTCISRPDQHETVEGEMMSDAVDVSGSTCVRDPEHPETELTSDDVRQQLAVLDENTHSVAVHEQQLPVCTPSPSPPAAPETVARQRTTQPSRTTSTTVESADQGRGKRRHKDDKSKTTDQSPAEHRHHRRWCLLM